MIASPPLLAERALAFAIGDPDWRDAIVGDLREEFVRMARRHGLPYARRWYWTQAMGVAAHRAVARVTGSRRAAPLAMPDPPESRAGSLSLFGHDLRAAWRSLRHQPALSLTVVAMLSLGLAANADDLRAGRCHRPAALPLSRRGTRRRCRLRLAPAFLRSRVCGARRLHRLAQPGARCLRSSRGHRVVGPAVPARWPAATAHRLPRLAGAFRDPRGVARCWAAH